MANAPKMTTCEVQCGNDWTTISIDEALARKERNGRCVECQMPVRAHRQANNGMAAHFEHLSKNPHCPLSDKRHGDHGHGQPQHKVPLTAPQKTVAADARPEPSAVEPLSVDDLARLRRQLAALLNTLDGGSGPQEGEGIWKRINRLSRNGGPVPREIAALMTTITEMRNSAEYEKKVLSASECTVVRHAWHAIQEWTRNRSSAS